MTHHEKTAFTHRPDTIHPGMLVSFCNRCFQTVGTSYWEVDLDHSESAHVCDPWERQYWNPAVTAMLRKKPKSEPIRFPATRSKAHS